MAVELRLRRKYTVVTHGHNKSAGGNSGSGKKRLEQPKGAKQEAQAATRDNQMMLVLVGGRKRTWVRIGDGI